MGTPAVQGRGPMGAPDLGEDASLWVVAPTLHHRVHKRMGHRAVRSFPVCWWFSVPVHRSWFLPVRPALSGLGFIFAFAFWLRPSSLTHC